jgi:hypothetical protein
MTNFNHGWNDEDFSSRCGDNSSELMQNVDVADRIGAGARQLLEDNTCIIELRDNRVSKLVAQRDPEYVQFLDPEDRDPLDKALDDDLASPEDALSHIEESRTPESPRIPWDVIRWVEARKDKDGNIVMVEESAPAFPRLRDKRPRGYAALLERLLTNGKLNGKQLFMAIRDAKNLNHTQVARLWELFKIQKFINKSK